MANALYLAIEPGAIGPSLVIDSFAVTTTVGPCQPQHLVGTDTLGALVSQDFAFI